MKKAISFMLSLAMCLTLCVPAFATKNSITTVSTVTESQISS